ncbi:hypothetical protein BCR34DRAFT_588604 [Clohesyomyces aquaticus]|uniref:Uncharacterized protein n=1 Tax=Clohesyomyces aquaticus TaxID=1231657 RepID=A0A1Y1ZJM0_9PLEO|nr:hypothetical protein BCR34DRAFT_588604 [Clohesyomyces aquaticus]
MEKSRYRKILPKPTDFDASYVDARANHARRAQSNLHKSSEMTERTAKSRARTAMSKMRSSSGTQWRPESPQYRPHASSRATSPRKSSSRKDIPQNCSPRKSRKTTQRTGARPYRKEVRMLLETSESDDSKGGIDEDSEEDALEDTQEDANPETSEEPRTGKKANARYFPRPPLPPYHHCTVPDRPKFIHIMLGPLDKETTFDNYVRHRHYVFPTNILDVSPWIKQLWVEGLTLHRYSIPAASMTGRYPEDMVQDYSVCRAIVEWHVSKKNKNSEPSIAYEIPFKLLDESTWPVGHWTPVEDFVLPIHAPMCNRLQFEVFVQWFNSSNFDPGHKINTPTLALTFWRFAKDSIKSSRFTDAAVRRIYQLFVPGQGFGDGWFLMPRHVHEVLLWADEGSGIVRFIKDVIMCPWNRLPGNPKIWNDKDVLWEWKRLTSGWLTAPEHRRLLREMRKKENAKIAGLGVKPADVYMDGKA